MLALLLSLALTGAPPVEVQQPHDGPPTLALSWSTDPTADCPSRATLLEAITARGLGSRIGDWVPTRHGQAELAVEVTVTRAEDRVRAKLDLTDADGRVSRSFEAQTCAALADATVLIVAVTLDPVAVSSSLRSRAASSRCRGMDLGPSDHCPNWSAHEQPSRLQTPALPRRGVGPAPRCLYLRRQVDRR